jgi:hypothetical protein
MQLNEVESIMIIRIFNSGEAEFLNEKTIVRCEKKPTLIAKSNNETIEVSLERWFNRLEHSVYVMVTYDSDDGNYSYLPIKEQENEYYLHTGIIEFINADEYLTEIKRQKKIQESGLTKQNLIIAGVFPKELGNILTDILVDRKEIILSKKVATTLTAIQDYNIALIAEHIKEYKVFKNFWDTVSFRSNNDDNKYQVAIKVIENKDGLIFVSEVLIKEQVGSNWCILRQIKADLRGNEDSNINQYEYLIV